MAYAIYTAKRSLAPNHAPSLTYTLQLVLSRADRRTTPSIRRQESLSGRIETRYYGSPVTWDVEVAPFPASHLPLYREFLDSTADGQQFTMNFLSELQADERLVIRDDDGYVDERFVQSGNGHRNDFFRVQFRVREAL
jgi:hypothetical protein